MCGRINHAGLTSSQLFDWLSRGFRPEFPEEPIPQHYNVPPMIATLRPDGSDLRLGLAPLVAHPALAPRHAEGAEGRDVQRPLRPGGDGAGVSRRPQT